MRPRSAFQLLSPSPATPHLPSLPLRTLTNLHSYLLFLRNNHLWECIFCTASSASLTVSASAAASHPPHPPQTPVQFLHSYLRFLETLSYGSAIFVPQPQPLSHSPLRPPPPTLQIPFRTRPRCPVQAERGLQHAPPLQVGSHKQALQCMPAQLAVLPPVQVGGGTTRPQYLIHITAIR